MSASTSDVLGAARSLGPLVREHAAQGDRDRRLPDPVVRAFTEAGLFRMCRPRGLGGLEVDPITMLQVIEELSRHDGAAGWCVMICGATGVLEAMVPRAAAAEMFAANTISNSVFASGGRAVEVEGGDRVSGRWSLASNSHHCDWLAGTSIVFKGEAPVVGPMGPEMVVPWFSSSDFKVIDTWDSVGLRGTGSHDFEVSDAFVPAARCFRFPLVPPEHDGPLFQFPVFAFFAVGIAGTALGIARAAIDELVRLAGVKTPLGMMSTLSTRSQVQVAVCQAETALRSGRAHLFDEVAKAWEVARSGRPASPQQRAWLRAACTGATLNAQQAVDLVYGAAGASSIFAASPLSRCFRDLHTLTQHILVATPSQEMIGRILLGVDPDAPLL
jgi:alkylation response protein AidB-like acyl-CoA dehydrogenase